MKYNIDIGKMARHAARTNADKPKATQRIEDKRRSFMDACTCDKPKLQCPVHDFSEDETYEIG